MPKGQFKEQEILNFKSLHGQFCQSNNNEKGESKSGLCNSETPAINNLTKTKNHSRTAMMIPKNKISTERISTFSLKVTQLTNTLSLIPFHYDDNENSGGDNIIIESLTNNKRDSKFKGNSRNDFNCLDNNANDENASYDCSHIKSNTTDSNHLLQQKDTNKTAYVKYSESEKLITSAIHSINQAEVFSFQIQNNKQKSNSTKTVKMLIINNKSLKNGMTFESSITKYTKPHSKFKSQNESSDSLLFSVISENNNNNYNKKYISNAYLPHQKVILDEDIINNKQLIIENHKGKLIEKKKLIINAAGLVNGLRNTRDGLTHFGYSQGTDNEKEIVNDYILHFNDRNISEMNTNNAYYNSTLFTIEFSLSHQAFYLIPHLTNQSLPLTGTSISKSNLMLKRIENCLWLTQRHFVQIEKTLLVFNIKDNDLMVECYSKGKTSLLKYSFSPKDSLIRIGNQNCAISIRDTNIRCKLNYESHHKAWVFKYDDDNENETTAETRLLWAWSLINSKEEIDDNLYMKIGKNVLKMYFI